MSHSVEIREKALAYWQRCADINLVISAYGVSRATLYAWQRRLQKTGNLADLPRLRGVYKIDKEKLKSFVEQNPDAYLKEIAKQFDCSAMAVSNTLKSIGMTRKKRRQPTKNKTQKK